jgi:chromosomal replication initiator protein
MSMTIEDIKRVSADECGVEVSDIDGRGRTGKVSLARSIAIYLSRKLKTGTCAEIGKAFDRDHSQVSSTWKNYSGYIETDSSLQSLIKKVEAKLG